MDLKLAWKDLEKPGRMFCLASEATKSLVRILLCVCVFFTSQFWPNNLLLFFSPTFRNLMMVPGRIVSCLLPSDEVLLTKISFLPVGWQSEVLLPAQCCYSWLPRPFQAEKVLDKHASRKSRQLIKNISVNLLSLSWLLSQLQFLLSCSLEAL